MFWIFDAFVLCSNSRESKGRRGREKEGAMCKMTIFRGVVAWEMIITAYSPDWLIDGEGMMRFRLRKLGEEGKLVMFLLLVNICRSDMRILVVECYMRMRLRFFRWDKKEKGVEVVRAGVGGRMREEKERSG